mmetsp:Transcript_65193/g.103275  ORF Transcript_65193/g.103275 Transcript_65193/m.103275 type:complete len:201 (+) Transcript_65193:66-668(+)
MLWDLLKLLCGVELTFAFLLLAAGDDFREELVKICGLHATEVRLARLGIAAFSGCSFGWSCLAHALVEVNEVEMGRNAAMSFVCLVFAFLVDGAVDTADRLVFASRQLRGNEANMRENEATKAKAAKAEKELAAARQECDELKQKLREANDKSDAQVAAIKRQAESQAEEYMRLMTENKSLRNQLEDFDLLMGGSRKKAA